MYLEFHYSCVYMYCITNDNDYVDYENMLLDKTLTPYLYQNDTMNGFLKRLQPLVGLLFDQMNIVKNFKNYIVDKDWYK